MSRGPVRPARLKTSGPAPAFVCCGTNQLPAWSCAPSDRFGFFFYRVTNPADPSYAAAVVVGAELRPLSPNPRGSVAALRSVFAAQRPFRAYWTSMAWW